MGRRASVIIDDDPDTFPCGHDRTDDNTRMRGGKPCCSICIKERDDRCNHGAKQRSKLMFERPLLELLWH